jgi:hypothetical protein
MTCAFPLCKDRETHFIVWQTSRGPHERPHLYCQDHYEVLIARRDSFRLILEAGKMSAGRVITSAVAADGSTAKLSAKTEEPGR